MKSGVCLIRFTTQVVRGRISVFVVLCVSAVLQLRCCSADGFLYIFSSWAQLGSSWCLRFFRGLLLVVVGTFQMCLLLSVDVEIQSIFFFTAEFAQSILLQNRAVDAASLPLCPCVLTAARRCCCADAKAKKFAPGNGQTSATALTFAHFR